MIIWDEYAYGKNIFDTGHIKTKKWQNKELKCLIHYMLSNDYKPKEIREKLEAVCNDDIKYLKDNQKKNIFNRFIQQCKKETFKGKKEITIYKDEIEKIKQLKNENYERVMFILLVLCKWYDDSECFSVLKNDLPKETKITKLNGIEQQSILTELNNLNYIKSDVKRLKDENNHKNHKVKKQTWSIPFLQKDGEVAFKIDNYFNVVFRYLDYVYGGYFECEVCNNIFKANNNKQKYCVSCHKEKQLEWQRESMKKQRQNK